MTRVLLPAEPRYEALAPALERAGFRTEVCRGVFPVPAGAGAVTVTVVPHDSLGPLRLLPPAQRRWVLVVAVVPRGTTGDPTTALALGANLVVTEEDLSRLPELLPAALEDHLRLLRLVEPEAAP